MKTLKRYTILAAGLLAATLSSLGAPTGAPTPEFVDTLVTPYLKIQSALAGDSLEAAQSGANAFLSAVDTGPADSDALKDLRGSADSIANAGDITAARAAFLVLSNGMIEMVRDVGTSGKNSLYLVHCPMAFGYKGGDWLQADQTVANPYFGASMLHCGGINEELGGKAQGSHQMQGHDMDHMQHEHGMMDPSGNPHHGMDMDAIHAGVPGYTAQSGGKKADSGCQMACCQSGS